MAEKKDGCWRMLAAVGLVAALACGCAGSKATVDHSGELSSEEGQIAFMRATSFNGSDIESDIYTINVDGTAERKLTDTPGLDGFPTWSPDGQRIAFVSDRAGGNWEIYVMRSDGTHQRRLTNTQEDEDEAALAWSPDGEKIAYATDGLGTGPLKDDPYDPSIWVMDADGSDRRRLIDGNWPSWSPDGERILYLSGTWTVTRLSVMNPDGSEQRNLGFNHAWEAVWSPDGEKIAFVSTDGKEDSEDIYTMNFDGSRRTRLTEIPGDDHWPPTWSPDGTRIAFTSDGTDGIGEIFVMNSEGSGLTELTHQPPGWLTSDPPVDAFPAWRP
jgi:Tol biopolymer transport system component